MNTLKSIIKTMLLVMAFTIISCDVDPVSDIIVTADLSQSTSMADFAQYIDTTPPLTVPNSTFYKDVPFGTGSEQKFDIFLPNGANSGNKASIAIYFHGGSYQNGAKEDIYDEIGIATEISSYVSSNIAYISTNYTLITDNNPDKKGVLRSMEDGTKLFGYLGSTPFPWNTTKAAAIGGSAGGGMAQFLANSAYEPYIKCISILNPQASGDIYAFNGVFQPTYPGFDIIAEALTMVSESTIYNYHGGASILELTTDITIMDNRAKIEFLSPTHQYSGATRIDNALSYLYPQDYNEVVHHQLHAKAIYDSALANTNSVAPIGNISFYGINTLISQTVFIKSHL